MRSWRAFIETVDDLMSALEGDLSAHDMTLGDYQVLVHLSESPERSMRMCDLAGLLQLSPSGLTRRLDGLVTRGLVARQQSPLDGRVSLAVLTSAGRAELERIAPHHVESVRAHLIDRVDAEDLDALARVFEAVRAGLDGPDVERPSQTERVSA
jgi:DNA-binding MarR family transcriptional regulator